MGEVTEQFSMPTGRQNKQKMMDFLAFPEV